MTWLGVAVGLLSAAVFGVAAVVQAQAVRGFERTPDGLLGFVIRSVRRRACQTRFQVEDAGSGCVGLDSRL